MKLGVLSLGDVPDMVLTIQSGEEGSGGIVPGTAIAGGSTTGPALNGDTLVCPQGFPYDYSIHDCSGYAGSAQDVAAQQRQASYDVCSSGGGMWNEALNRCVMPSTSLISGVPNSALVIAGGILVLAMVMGRR